MRNPKDLKTQEPNSLRLVFFGTPDYVITVLEALKTAGYELATVVTQPPKPVGRKKIITPSPVAHWAKQNGIEIIDKSPKEIYPLLSTLHPQPRIGILAAYGRIIPSEIINYFPLGILNIHPSILPKYRGASPIEAALAADEKETGVTIIKLDSEMDHGPIVTQIKDAVLPNDSRITLRDRLFKIGANLLTEILPNYLEGRMELKEQNHEEATFTTLMKKDHGFIPGNYVEAALQGLTLQTEWQVPFIKNFSLTPSPLSLDHFIKAVSPWPGAFTNVKLRMKNEEPSKRLKILKAHVEEIPTSHPHNPTRLPQPTSIFILDLVQLEGKNPVSWEQFEKGYPEASF